MSFELILNTKLKPVLSDCKGSVYSRLSFNFKCILLSLKEDPALTRWVHARGNSYPYFRPTFKTSLMGLMFGVAPLFALYFIFKTDRVGSQDALTFLSFSSHSVL